ncbi:hypothetical protein [Agrilutibacter solisilvae]|uniref:Uncharacterized protein n=1 Tax=Agrilutibacter solisilvae TaxID=2763317 RepID=A0A975ATL3_9GAMM|nr:hypothetical protein [Lysobacter solisilvae]QSX79418.1 hypothetical protein I8J32_006030 [Lysobacter solisilvae]
MLRASAGLLVIGWLVVCVLYLAGTLAWDNRLLWICVVAFPSACMMGLAAAAEEGSHRLAAVGVALAALASCLLFGVFYFFLFGLVGS